MSRRPSLLALLLLCGLALQAVPARAELVIGSGQKPSWTPVAREDLTKLAEGEQALRARQYDKAEKAFSDVFRGNPNSTEAMVGLAAVAQGQGKPERAREWMTSAAAMAPGNPTIIQVQARLLLEQGSPAAAVDCYRRAIAANPSIPQLRLDLASFYLEQLKKPAEAIAVLRELVQLRPDMASAHMSLGLALAADGKLDEAGRSVEEAIRRDNGNPSAYHALGLVALRQGRNEQALSAFDKAIALRPESAGSVIGRGDALFAQGKHDQALAAYKQAATLAPGSFVPHGKRAHALERLKRADEAEAAYRDALRVEPNNAMMLNNLAFLLVGRKSKLDEALKMAQRAVMLDPATSNYSDTLGVVLLARGDVPGARRAFERALSQDPGNTALRQRVAQLGTPAAPAAPVNAPTPVAVAVSRPAAPEPAPLQAQAPSAPSARAEDPAAVVARRMEAWRAAWEAKDAGRYLGFYAQSFVPADKRARTAWEADRRVKLDKKGDISVQIQAPKFSVTGDSVSVTFEQRYKSGAFNDSGRKQLDWVREGGEWKIRREAQL